MARVLVHTQTEEKMGDRTSACLCSQFAQPPCSCTDCVGCHHPHDYWRFRRWNLVLRNPRNGSQQAYLCAFSFGEPIISSELTTRFQNIDPMFVYGAATLGCAGTFSISSLDSRDSDTLYTRTVRLGLSRRTHPWLKYMEVDSPPTNAPHREA